MPVDRFDAVRGRVGSGRREQPARKDSAPQAPPCLGGVWGGAGRRWVEAVGRRVGETILGSGGGDLDAGSPGEQEQGTDFARSVQEFVPCWGITLREEVLFVLLQDEAPACEFEELAPTFGPASVGDDRRQQDQVLRVAEQPIKSFLPGLLQEVRGVLHMAVRRDGLRFIRRQRVEA